MKHFLFVLALLFLTLDNGFAQRLPAGRTTAPASEYEAPTTTFADSINAVFQNLDKSRVASGILEDYGLQFLDHAPFTGTGGFTADNQLDMGRWRALYGDLYGARINTAAMSMASLAAVNQALAQYAPEPSVELPILHFNYHRFRPDAVSSGRLRSVRNRLSDVPGQNPYQPATMFGVAASATALPSATPAFIFRPSLFFTNTGRTVATLQADFADGLGFVGLSWDVARTVGYATAGPKDVRVRVGYTDGSIWESHLLVVAPAPAPLARYSGTPNLDFPLTADRAYSGPAASARITVEYGGRNKANPDPAVLDKPLIVVKGFDVSGIIGGPGARSTYERFVTRQLNQTQGSILSDGADLDGYDIVYVDFDNGVDYLQNNAFLLERVIRWVNQNKTGTQPNAMLTMSMGGLIAQYALRDIETNPANTAYPHQVRLLVTHDSPHQGANAPLSLQMAIRQLAGTVIRNPLDGSSIALVDRFPVLGQGRDALLSPAAQQLLRYQTQRQVGIFGTGGPVVAAPTSLYDTFQQEYQALLGAAKVPVGTPGQPCRVVSSSNGSECGKGQPYAPYAELVRLNVDSELFDLPVFAGVLVSAFTGAPTILLSGTYYLRANVRLNALPDQQQAEICLLDVRVDKIGDYFNLHFSLINYHGNSLASQLPLDSSSGGAISLAAYAQQTGGGTALPPGLLKQSQFCFVPTFSALNITPTSSAATRAQYSPGTNVGTPFINFRTAARENEGHLEYTALKSTWMLQELRQMQPVMSCLAFCQAATTISANPTAEVCTNTDFSIAGLPANATVQWRAEPQGLLVSSSFTGPVFTATASGAGSGQVQLRAAVSSACGEFVLQRTVYVGIPEQADLQAAPTSANCSDGMAYFHIANYQASFTYTITNRHYANGGAIKGADFWVKTGPGITAGSFTLTVRNTCGATVSDVYVEYPPCASPTTTYTIAPNPATDEVLVQPMPAPDAATTSARTATASPGNPAGISIVRLYDSYGRLRLEQAGHGAASLRLRVGELPAGLYVVHVLHDGNQVSRQQLQLLR